MKPILETKNLCVSYGNTKILEDLDKWHEYADLNGDADDFIIRVKKD